MTEVHSILAAVRKLRAEGSPFLCATVVGVRGSSYRRPGARLIATPERRVAGCVSGGCLEKDLLRTSWWRTRGGPVVVRYDSAESDSPHARLGCGGEIDVLLERGNAAAEGPHPAGRAAPEADGIADPMTLVERALAAPGVSALATVFRSEAPSVPVGARFALVGDEFSSATPGAGAGTSADAVRGACEAAIAERRVFPLSAAADDGAFDALIEAVVPPPHLFLFGAGLDALPVAESALRLGWTVTVWEHTARIDSQARFARSGATLAHGDLDAVRAAIARCDRALAVVMGHDVDRDRAALAMLLRSTARYIGVLGPRHRTAALAGPGELDDPRVHAPVGLDLGAETPEEIALAITAEMLAAVRVRSTSSLRTRPTIHA